MDKIVVIGGGGHASSVLDTLLSMNIYNVVGLIDSNYSKKKSMFGVPYIGDDSILEELYNNGVKHAIIAIGSVGDTRLRYNLYNKAKVIGFILPTIIDPTAIVGRECTFGKGVFVGKGSIINALCEVGEMAIINSGTLLEHQCKIGAFSHIAPGCKLGGNVTIGEHTHIGIGTTIIQGISIGDNSLIGAGSNVIRNIKSDIKAYGNPCREVDER